MIKNSLDKIKGYVGIANRAKYVIYGIDNLKGYTHKLYLVLYRQDMSKTLNKTINELQQKSLPCCAFEVEDFNYITNSTNCKIFAIKNKGISEQILKVIKE